MFQATKIRLTLLHAVVFFLLFVICGMVLYGVVQSHLFGKVDTALKDRVNNIRIITFSKKNAAQPSSVNPSPVTTPAGESDTVIEGTVKGVLDPRIVLIFWDKDGHIVRTVPESIMDTDLEPFRIAEPGVTSRTISVDGHSYRSYQAPYVQRPKSGSGGNKLSVPAGATPIAEVQAISVVDSELSMLCSILIVLLAAGIASLFVTVFAGMYLASRALVPIRTSWEKQQQFVADASHELRTPITVIQANAEQLFRHPDRTIEEESATVSAIMQETRRMNKLVHSLLTLARHDSGQLEIVREAVRLGEVAATAAGQFEPVSIMQDVKLLADIDNHVRIAGDAERLHQLLVILVDNAFKYTPSGGTIKLICRQAGSSAEWIVEDTGAGIMEADLPRIFDRFYRGDRARSRSEGGAGLGLSIAKWIIDMHNGTISVNSMVGKGTKVTVRFPLLLS
jgi:two-component system sensor histidine kinase CiaH